MLRDTSELAKNTVSKNPIIFKVLLEKILEFLLRHRIFGLKTTFLLVSLLDYYPIEKQSSKWDPIWPINPYGFKMVLILLAELIAI